MFLKPSGVQRELMMVMWRQEKLLYEENFFFLEERRIRKSIIKTHNVMSSTEKIHQEIIFSIS